MIYYLYVLIVQLKVTYNITLKRYSYVETHLWKYSETFLKNSGLQNVNNPSFWSKHFIQDHVLASTQGNNSFSSSKYYRLRLSVRWCILF